MDFDASTTRNAFLARMRAGTVLSARDGRIVHAGFGYRRTGRDVVVDAGEAALVRAAYEDVAAGASPAAVARRLARAAPARGPWTGRKVSRMVRDALHAGVVVWGRTRSRIDPLTGVRSSVPVAPDEVVVARRPDLAIVDGDLFDSAIAALGRRVRRGGTPANGHVRYSTLAGDVPPAGPVAFGYARVASACNGQTSLARQAAAIEAHADAGGMRLSAVFSDQTSGASLIGRAGLRSMTDELRTGGVGVVIVEDLDRLSRYLPDLLAIYRQFERDGVDLHTTRGGRVSLLDLVARRSD